MVSFFISPHLPYFHLTMKINNSALSAILMIMLLALSSCAKEADDPRPNPIEDFTMIVDGKPWEASPDGPHSKDAVIVDFNTTSNIIIDAFAENGSYVRVNLAVEGGIKVDSTYRATDDDVIFQALYKLDYASSKVYTNLSNRSGEITFTGISPNAVNGWFNFKGERSDTAGVITVEYGGFVIIQ